MLKKIFIFLIVFFCFSFPALAKERYIYFIEDSQYKDLYNYKNIKKILDKSVQGLGIQRGGGCEFTYFYSILKKRPSNIKLEEFPLYYGNENIDNIYFKGYVEIDGTLYVPSKILANGQTASIKLDPKERVYIEHVKDIQILDNELEKIGDTLGVEVIISSWSKNYKNNLNNYIMPIAFYNNKDKGIFYSETTRNIGILDYENINAIIAGDMSKLKILQGDINEIHGSRIIALKNKKVFLTRYGYFMEFLTVINSLFLIYKSKNLLRISSLFVIISPFSILIEPLFQLDSLSNKIEAIIIITFLFYLCVKSIGLKSISILFLIIIYFDAIFFRLLLNNSLLSYEPALGARFYGIGNEYLGIIVAYILIYISEGKLKHDWMIWTINAVLLLYDGGGSNFGGFLTCFVIGFYLSPILIKLLEVVFGAVLIAVAKNHIGVFFKNFFKLNMSYITDTIVSKLNTVKGLLRMNIWTELTIVLILIYIYNLLKGRLKFNGKTRIFMISCILVVIFNDSGIVSCALILMVYLNYIFYSLLTEEKDGI